MRERAKTAWRRVEPFWQRIEFVDSILGVWERTPQIAKLGLSAGWRLLAGLVIARAAVLSGTIQNNPGLVVLFAVLAGTLIWFIMELIGLREQRLATQVRPELPAPDDNPNLPLVGLINEYSARALRLISPSVTPETERQFNEIRHTFRTVSTNATGQERRILERFEQAASLVVFKWKNERTGAKNQRAKLIRELRYSQEEAGRILAQVGSRSTLEDRTNSLPRIRALLRQQRDEGHRILSQGDLLNGYPDDIFPQLERWSMRTGDLLLDAYGVEIKHEFRHSAGSMGVRAFEPLVLKVGEFVERAEDMKLLETFRFEDWETYDKNGTDLVPGS